MEKGRGRRRRSPQPHCLILPFPIQGHINPLLQFAHRLRSKGITRFTLVLPARSGTVFPATPFPVETISDGRDGTLHLKTLPEEYFNRSREIGSDSLRRLLEKLRSSSAGADCLIYSSLYPWAQDVAREYGLTAAVFFTQSNSVNAVFFQAYIGDLKLPVSDPEIRISGVLPVLQKADLPSFIKDSELDPGRSWMMVNQFMNFRTVDWVFVNTFHELEPEVCEWMAGMMRLRTIGPTIPSMYTDRRIPDDREYGLNIFTPVTDACTNWLDRNDVGSVIYVSFGSFAQPTAEQIAEVAGALVKCRFNFLWVVRASEEDKLPENFRAKTSEKGLIVTWCNQLEILGHKAIGCFVTHCGWNSTLETINAGVPVVALPQWSDQFTNAKMVADVWGFGVRVEEDEEGTAREDEIVRCVETAMAGEMRKKAEKWRKLAIEAVSEGGSSDKNVEEFVNCLFDLVKE